jgi:hypothetical protein
MLANCDSLFAPAANLLSTNPGTFVMVPCTSREGLTPSPTGQGGLPKGDAAHFGNETGRSRRQPSSGNRRSSTNTTGQPRWRLLSRLQCALMTRAPKIPMLPSALPQQRISEVTSIPQRPAAFSFAVGYGDLPDGIVPKRRVPRSPDLLIQVEWAQTPMNFGINAFYIQARKKNWILWLRTLDDNCYPWKWDWLPIGSCDRKGIDKYTAAMHLLLEYWRWRFDAQNIFAESSEEPYDWINEEGLLSISDIRAIVRELRVQRAEHVK